MILRMGYILSEAWGPISPEEYLYSIKEGLFIFESEGYFDPQGVVHEFSQVIDSLRLTDNQVIQYSKAISEYLERESGETYGREIVYP